MPQLQAVIFDMDGTLMDSSRTVPAAYAAAIHELSGRRCTDQEIIAEYGAGPAAALLERFIGRPGSEADVDCWIGHLARLRHHTVVYPGIVEALELLLGRGVQLAIFTGAVGYAAGLQLAHSALDRFFEVVVGSDEIAAVKPAPDGILRACELLEVVPSRAAYVGDALNDLRAARAAGALAVGAAWGHLYEPMSEADITLDAPAALASLLIPR